MQPESPAQSKNAEPDSTQCPNCRAQLPRGMRFCRACGFRLGEGLDEYVETVRLKPRVSAGARPASTEQPNAAPKADPFQPQAWGAMAPQAAGESSLKVSAQIGGGGRKKTHWMIWMVIAIIVISVLGGGLLTPFALRGRFGGTAATTRAKRSYFGVNGFKNADGGAFIDYAYPPGGPADKAGLLGGDVVISFDGQPVKSDNDIRSLLAATPIGKTVDVVFLRDGQTRTTKLTTISKEELDRLDNAFDNREDKGYLKEGTDIDRVIVPGMNIYGVRLNRIGKSGPADMAGLKDGDIVIEFDGIPTRTRRELEQRIERAQPYSTVTVVVIRDGQRLEIPVKVGIEP
jgi:membrane-associated protease RseP (regulator of RpoE activity)